MNAATGVISGTVRTRRRAHRHHHRVEPRPEPTARSSSPGRSSGARGSGPRSGARRSAPAHHRSRPASGAFEPGSAPGDHRAAGEHHGSTAARQVRVLTRRAADRWRTAPTSAAACSRSRSTSPDSPVRVVFPSGSAARDAGGPRRQLSVQVRTVDRARRSPDAQAQLRRLSRRPTGHLLSSAACLPLSPHPLAEAMSRRSARALHPLRPDRHPVSRRSRALAQHPGSARPRVGCWSTSCRRSG